MVFNDTTTLDSICSEMDRLCSSDDTLFTLKAKAARANQALDRFFFLALTADGRWQFDDSNYTDFPIGTTNLVSGQQDYSFASDVLMIDKVLSKDSAGNWVELVPVDMSQSNANMAARNIWTLPSNNGGSPNRYDVFANSILLDPIPNYASTGGLKVVFQRQASKFVSTDTTKAPGIPVIFHGYIARYASRLFFVSKGKPVPNDLVELIHIDEAAITEFISKRNKVVEQKIVMKYRSSR